MSFNFTGLQNKEKGKGDTVPALKTRKKDGGRKKNAANLAVISPGKEDEHAPDYAGFVKSVWRCFRREFRPALLD